MFGAVFMFLIAVHRLHLVFMCLAQVAYFAFLAPGGLVVSKWYWWWVFPFFATRWTFVVRWFKCNLSPAWSLLAGLLTLRLRARTWVDNCVALCMTALSLLMPKLNGTSYDGLYHSSFPSWQGKGLTVQCYWLNYFYSNVPRRKHTYHASDSRQEKR